MTATDIKDILLAEAKQYLDYYIDSDNRVFAAYLATDGTGQYYQYAIIGRLKEAV